MNISGKSVLAAQLLILAACTREELAPVQIKLDEGFLYEGLGEYPEGVAVHKVAEGETLFDIANKYSIDPMNLAKLNSIEPPYKVYPGQMLKLPKENKSGDLVLDLPEEKSAEKVQEDKEFDEEFSSVLALGVEKDAPKSSKGQSNRSSDEEAEKLSTPKIKSQKKENDKKSDSKKSDKKIDKPTSTSSRWVKPVNGEIISNFGDLVDGVANDGVNISVPKGTLVKAAAAGKVIYTGNGLGEDYKNVVIIDHGTHKGEHLVSSSALLGEMKVKKGAQVKAGDVIGTVGNDKQLHYEIMKKTKTDATPVNPAKYVNF